MSTSPVPENVGQTYMKPEEVAVLLRVDTKSIYRWSAKDPTMPALKIGGVLRFHRERLERWLREREQGVARQRPSQKPLRPGATHPGRPGQVLDLVPPAAAGADVLDVEPGPMGQTVGQKAPRSTA